MQSDSGQQTQIDSVGTASPANTADPELRAVDSGEQEQIHSVPAAAAADSDETLGGPRPAALTTVPAILHFNGPDEQTSRVTSIMRARGFEIIGTLRLSHTESEIVVNSQEMAARVDSLLEDLKQLRPGITVRIDRERGASEILVRLTGSGT